MCRKGDIEMQAMDEKISFLKMKVAEKERQIKFWLKALPMKRVLDAELVVLQIQVSGKEIFPPPFVSLILYLKTIIIYNISLHVQGLLK